MKRDGGVMRTRTKTKGGAKAQASARDSSARGDGTMTKAARTRNRILEATAVVLNREGYAGTSLTDISELADLQAPAIYYHFPSRDAVIEATIAAGQKATIDYVAEALNDLPHDAPAMERLLTAAAAHLRTTLERSAFSSASTRCFPQLPLAMQERLEPLRVEYGSMWRHLFDEAARAKSISEELDALSAMMLTLGALNWAVEWWDPRRGNLDELQRTTRMYILRALAPRPEAQ
ncbi:TetR/AcrR family transcriptional regulator [Rhodococcus erythropolis]|uniref:TetR/AcrR family transcriptional regulator n=1 Tax=Rhodococcus erythropolis TaxID=1833 RepID=UPI0022276690|nr:TetR/AcrR family transcriptional regulator [Rhodococcus erythropolis]MCW2295436.1 AcrR family transcriptional regulator [Rhodococcus erythropolis]